MANEFVVRKGLITIGGDTVINNDQGSFTFTVKSSGDNFGFVVGTNSIAIGNTPSSDRKLHVVATSSGHAYSIFATNTVSTTSNTFGIYSDIGTSNSGSSYGIFSRNVSDSPIIYGGYFSSSDAFRTFSTSAIAIRTLAELGSGVELASGSSYGAYFETSHLTTGTTYGCYISAVGGTNFSIIRPTVYGSYIQAEGGTNCYGSYLDAFSGSSSNTALYTSRGNVILNAAGGSGMGRTGIGVTSPTANLHIKAGTATASTAPIKLTTGTVLTTPEAGAIEYTNPLFYLTNGDAIRHRVYMDVYGLNEQDNSVVNSTTLVTIGGMSVSLAANRQYEIEVMAIINATSPFGMKGALNYTGTFTYVRTYSNLFSGTSIITSVNNSTGSTLVNPEFSSTTTTVAMFLLKGHLNTSASGTLSFQGAQAASGANGTIFRIGSYIRCRPIG